MSGRVSKIRFHDFTYVCAQTAVAAGFGKCNFDKFVCNAIIGYVSVHGYFFAAVQAYSNRQRFVIAMTPDLHNTPVEFVFVLKIFFIGP